MTQLEKTLALEFNRVYGFDRSAEVIANSSCIPFRYTYNDKGGDGQANLYLIGENADPAIQEKFLKLAKKSALYPNNICNNWEHFVLRARTLQHKGEALFAIWNGRNQGTKKEDITRGWVYHTENDDYRPIDEKLNDWARLGNLEPSAKILTQGKSCHGYRTFVDAGDDGICIKQLHQLWLQEVKRGFDGFADSHESWGRLATQSFRLPGFQKRRDCVTKVVELVELGRGYSYQEIYQYYFLDRQPLGEYKSEENAKHEYNPECFELYKAAANIDFELVLHPNWEDRFFPYVSPEEINNIREANRAKQELERKQRQEEREKLLAAIPKEERELRLNSLPSGTFSLLDFVGAIHPDLKVRIENGTPDNAGHGRGYKEAFRVIKTLQDYEYLASQLGLKLIDSVEELVNQWIIKTFSSNEQSKIAKVTSILKRELVKTPHPTHETCDCFHWVLEKTKLTTPVKPQEKYTPLLPLSIPELEHCELVNNDEIDVIIGFGVGKHSIIAQNQHVVIELKDVKHPEWSLGFVSNDNRKILELYAKESNRQFYIILDDTKYTTTQDKHILARWLSGQTKKQVKFIINPDLSNIDNFNSALKYAVSLTDWEVGEYTTVDIGKLNVEFDQPYFPSNYVPIVPEGTAIITLEGMMSKGKTTVVSNHTTKNTEDGIYTIGMTHRRSLEGTLSSKLKLNKILDLWSGKYNPKYTNKGFVGCGDSINKMIAFKDHKNIQDGNYDLFLEETNQNLRHLLFSNKTEISKGRADKLEKFIQLIKGCRYLILADADLDTETVRFLNQIKPGGIFRIANTHTPENREVVTWDDLPKMVEAGIMKRAFSDAPGGIFVTTQASTDVHKAEQSKYSPMLLKALLEKCGRPIYAIDGLSINDPDCEEIEGVLSSGDAFNSFMQKAGNENAIVIASNIIGTGVSIDAPHNFKYAFHIKQGIGTPEDAVQEFHRLRELVDTSDMVERHLFVNETGLSMKEDGSVSPYLIEKSIENKLAALRLGFASRGQTIDNDLISNQIIENYSYYLAAKHNLSCSYYKGWVYSMLVSKWNYKLISCDAWAERLTITPDNAVELSDNFLFVGNEYENATGAGISEALNIGKRQLSDDINTSIAQRQPLPKEIYEEKNRNTDGLTRREQEILIRSDFEHTFEGTLEATPDAIAQFKNGYHRKLQLHYYILHPDQLAIREALKLEGKAKGRRVHKTDLARGLYSGAVNLIQKVKFNDVLVELGTVLNLYIGENSLYNNIYSVFSPEREGYFKGVPLELPPNGLALELDPKSKPWVELCEEVRSGRGELDCKAMLGFNPAPKYNLPILKELFEIVGLSVITKGKGKAVKYYLVGFGDKREKYFKVLSDRYNASIHDGYEGEFLKEAAINPQNLISSTAKNALKAYVDSAELNPSFTQLAAVGEKLPDTVLEAIGYVPQPQPSQSQSQPQPSQSQSQPQPSQSQSQWEALKAACSPVVLFVEDLRRSVRFDELVERLEMIKSNFFEEAERLFLAGQLSLDEFNLFC